MPAGKWKHWETVCLVDIIDQQKHDKWTPQERIHLVAEVKKSLQARGTDPKAPAIILDRIRTLGKEWMEDGHKASQTVFRYGWTFFLPKCRREILLCDPDGIRIPKGMKHSFKLTPMASPDATIEYPHHEEWRDTALITTPSAPPYSPITISRSPVTASQNQPEDQLTTSYDCEMQYNMMSDDITDYLAAPERYQSTGRSVDSVRQRLLRTIRSAVENLLIASETADTQLPMLYDWLQLPLGAHLLSKIYGSSSEVHVSNHVSRVLSTHTSQSSLDLGQFLQVMLAAAISEWILEKKHDALPQDPTKRNWTWRDIELNRKFPALSEQMLRRERYSFVQRKEGWQGSIDRLASHFFLGTESMLRVSLNKFPAAVSEWNENLRQVFITAMDLYGEIMLWAKEVTVYWPVSGAIFYPTFMGTEEADGPRGPVLVALFPGVIEKDADMMSMLTAPTMDGLVFRSLVLLQ